MLKIGSEKDIKSIFLKVKRLKMNPIKKMHLLFKMKNNLIFTDLVFSQTEINILLR
jgi:hypothetical protein